MIARPYLCLVHFPRVQITAPQSTVHNWLRNPPAVLPLTEGGGGGPELFISFEQIWTVHEKALRSTVHNGFRTPPAVLPLTEGGGSGIVYKLRADLDGSKSGAQINGPQWIPDPPRRSTFNGGGGVRRSTFNGGGGVRNCELKSTLI
jgi:hypothetical protein